MQNNDLIEALVLQKKLYSGFTEVFDLSRQLAEAIDRQDTVSVRMLIGMRQDPINRLAEIRGSLVEKISALPPEDGERLRALLNGGAAQGPAESQLAEQVAVNQRLLDKLLALDKRLNQKIGDKKSLFCAR